MASPDVLRRQTIDKHPPPSPRQQDFIAPTSRIKNRPHKSTREKIEKLVSEGAKNYPAYLKLIYTGESDFSSDFSSEDEGGSTKPGAKSVNRKLQKSIRNAESKQKLTSGNEKNPSSKASDFNGDSLENIPLTPCARENQPGLPGQPELKEAPMEETKDDSFYDTVGQASPEYDNAVNQSNQEVDPEEKARLEEEWRQDLAKLEEEITTLRSVLGAKVRAAAEIKHKLGITPITEFKQDVKQGIQNIKETEAYKKTNEQLSKLNEKITASSAYQKTNETIHHLGDSISGSDAYQKTNATFKSIGAWSSKKLGDIRNSNTFKSFEEKVGSTYTNVKSKVRGSKSEQSFEEALSAANQDGAAGGTENNATSPSSLPEEKVPL